MGAGGSFDPVAPRAALDELDQLAVLSDRLRTAVWDVREDSAPDPVQAALDLTQHLELS